MRREFAVNIVGRLMKPLIVPRPPEMGDDPAAKRLSQVVTTVLGCCHLALFTSRFDSLVPVLDTYDKELRGFAYEGAGMGLASLDCWLPWKHRTRDFVLGPAARYMHAVYLGAGLAHARMGRNPERFHNHLPDPFCSWAVFDGYGFLKGFAHRAEYVEDCKEPTELHGYARRVFDQGVGRSIWFSHRADVEKIAATVNGFREGRRADLWSGVGYACGYAGGGDALTLEMLGKTAGEHRSSVALGVVAAAHMRHVVGNAVEHNDAACQAVCGLSSLEAARLADATRDEMRSGDPGSGGGGSGDGRSAEEPDYEIWRRRIQERFA